MDEMAIITRVRPSHHPALMETIADPSDDPGGIIAISRRLSVATPPVMEVTKSISNPEGWQSLRTFQVR
jgi:hypothetical protein